MHWFSSVTLFQIILVLYIFRFSMNNGLFFIKNLMEFCFYLVHFDLKVYNLKIIQK